LRIGTIEDGSALAISSARRRIRARHAELVANVATTKAVDAVAAQAFARGRAGDAIERFAGARATTTIWIVAGHGACGIDRVIGYETTNPDNSVQIARFAGFVACRIATNAIRAEAARAIRIRSARLTIVTFATPDSVARVRPGTQRRVITACSDVHAHTLRGWRRTRHAEGCARGRAAKAIGAERACTFIPIDAAGRRSFEARAKPVADGATVIVAGIIQGRERIRRNARCGAGIIRAIIHVIGNVALIHD
jgi:hypothetical protein